MRHRLDPEYGAICSSARLGQITPTQLAKLNQRLQLTFAAAAAKAPSNSLLQMMQLVSDYATFVGAPRAQRWVTTAESISRPTSSTLLSEAA
mmetsp:Transcript_36893/g.62122  ORF Transcript_36893/g.62122 Transcript_36893/m.62122 type:complete len:92 (+) Transcript_36893:244-519(+)